MTNGRGAWNNAGLGGTKHFKDSTKPGPYYYIGSGDLHPGKSQDNFAVHYAVKAYQRALNRRLEPGTVVIDGHYGTDTAAAVTQFQAQQPKSLNLTVWGGIGPDTSMLLLLPDLNKVVAKTRNSDLLTPVVVAGIIRHESGWDCGAVGFVDNTDLGLAQINGPSHPSLSDKERLQPVVSFNFAVGLLNNALHEFDNNLRDAIASYNLGIGGARRWIAQGRPQFYTPAGTSTARDVWAYINTVLEG